MPVTWDHETQAQGHWPQRALFSEDMVATFSVSCAKNHNSGARRMGHRTLSTKLENFNWQF